ncbi:MAG: YciI family protein [Pseudomonadota bacterium]
MSDWTDYVAKARERGSLGAEFYAVLSRPAQNAARMPEVLPKHLEFLQDLEKRRILVFAGPLSDASGTSRTGEGLLVLRAASIAEADRLAAADPMHLEGCRAYTVQGWLINEGHIPDELRPLDRP